MDKKNATLDRHTFLANSFKSTDLRHASFLAACRMAFHEAIADHEVVDLEHVTDVTNDEVADLQKEVDDLSHFLWRPQHA